jgi:3-oxoacyl-[acyl-carrier protein] reductase
MGELDGRVAIVTGSSRGIGAGIAQRLAAAGATVVLGACSDSQPAGEYAGTVQQMAQLIGGRGGKALSIVLDLESETSRAEFVEEALERTGRIDILVNNAGTGLYGKIDQTPMEVVLNQANVFLLGPWDLCRRVVPHMKKRGEGWIVNVGSVAAFPPEVPPFEDYPQARGDETPYATFKAAMHRFSAALACELYSSNISVNVVMPVASVSTPAFEALLARNAATNGTSAELVRENWVEPIEHISEATVALVACDPTECTGKVAISYLYLDELGRSTMTLDGQRIFQERKAPVSASTVEAEILRRIRMNRGRVGRVP